MDRMANDVSQLRADLTRLLSDLEERTRANEMRCASCEPRIEAMREDLDTLKGQSRVWGGINSIAAIIAGLIGYLKNP